MRTGLSTIQQTLTPEAASVLTRSISEAARRSHGQTTPLHVAATLLATPSGLLRQACVRSHPQSSHPLQCRALELCFSVALDRLPGGGAGVEPPISNALMAALKRAQANQRRGCPEQQQQPLLAVKVELEQLLISILDDPSVSRVMREASFSSVAVKIAIEQSLPSSASTTTTASARSIASFATGTSPAASRIITGLSLTNRAPPCHSLYINPRLYQHHSNGEQVRTEEVTRVLDVLSRLKNRNPILVGDSNADVVMREVLQRIRSGDAPPHLLNAQVLLFPKEIATASPRNLSQIIRELSSSIDSMIGGQSGVIIHLGDLKWLGESHGFSDASRSLTEEIGKLLKTFQKGDQVWLIGTASCETYLRCQIHHPTMENDWDLQAVPIAPSSSITNTFPRIGGTGILSNSLKRLAPMNCTGSTVASKEPSEIANPSQSTALCPLCSASYQHELATLGCKEFNKPSTKAEAMPQWLQLAMLDNGSNSTKPSSSLLEPEEEQQQLKESTEELLKRWSATCSSLHPTAQSMNKLQLTLSQSTTAQPTSPPSSALVRTDLVLGNSKLSNSFMANTDSRKCIQDTFFDEQRPKVSSISDIDTFKRLFKGLADKVSCQHEAALAVATAVLQCKSGNGRRRKAGTKGDIWLLLIGHDKVGKRKMASALSELIFGTGPTFITFGHSSCTEGDYEESTYHYRGRTPMDRIVEAVCRSPFSVIMLEDIDRADMVFQGKIRQGIERGRLLDSHGREVSLGSVIFVLTTDWVSEDLKSSYDSLLQHEEKVLDSAYYGVGLELSIGDKLAKRRPDWLREDDQCVKHRKESLVSGNLSLNLNLPMGIDAEGGEGSRNSSDLTAEHECDKGCRLSISELLGLVDETITFKPVDFGLLRRNVLQSTSVKFAAIMGKGSALRIDDDALDRIIAGLWLEGTDFEDWAERVLVPSFKQLRNNSKMDAGVVVVRLSTIKGDRPAQRPKNSTGNWLPTTITVAFDGANDN
ncbi:protein SMAX1-like isoform X1 [Zingiber officinale]|uniref:Clp R domain-containing protein n=1 Tax=Zingiber officinale TaxID=94328 RepID=A0A8J5F4G8_ZINOF|nr:protein SMAX1-like isoform X1 [Zingiber officinale]KAG6481571.1 hypothetical protein ZIOFF_058175 [Zingiber officinale]